MPNHFCPQCGTPLTLQNVCWRVVFPQEVIDAATAPFLLDWLNDRFGSTAVRSAGQALLRPDEWAELRDMARQSGGDDLTFLSSDSSSVILRTFLNTHAPARLDVYACCPHCGQPRGDSPGQDLPPGFFDFAKVIGVAVAGGMHQGKTCLLLSLLLDECRALNQPSALNPARPGMAPRFEFTAPRLSDHLQGMLQRLAYPPYQCPQGTRALEEPIPLEMRDTADGKRYLILIYDTAGEFFAGNQEAQLRFLEYAAGVIYLIDPSQTALQPARPAGSGRSLRPLDAAAQAARQADPSKTVSPSQWRKSAPAAPAEPPGNLLRNLCGLNRTQNLLPRAREQHIAYTLVKADRLYQNEQGPLWQLCGANVLLPAQAGGAGAYYLRCEVNEQLFRQGGCALHRTFQQYLPHYSLHTVSALGSEPVVDGQTGLYHLSCAPQPHLAEEPLLAVIRHGLE